MANQLAAQMYTLRDFTKSAEGLAECLEILHGIGYAGVQLSAVACMDGDSPKVTAKQARELLDANGLQCVATHRPLDRLIDHTEAEIEFHRTLGCDYIAIGGFWSDNDTAAGFRRFIHRAKPMVAKLNAAGIKFGYHNHAHEFVKDAESGKSLLDLIIDEAPEMQLEVDTYWVQHAGVDPEAFLRRIPGRIDAIHMKDKEVVPKDGPVMAPVGEGNMDWDGIIAALKAGGTKWYIVEQDVCRRDPFDCLNSSFEYLAGKGLAD